MGKKVVIFLQTLQIFNQIPTDVTANFRYGAQNFNLPLNMGSQLPISHFWTNIF